MADGELRVDSVVGDSVDCDRGGCNGGLGVAGAGLRAANPPVGGAFRTDLGFRRPGVAPGDVPALSPGLTALGGIERSAATLFVASVRTGEEKVFAWELLGRGIDYFLPLVELAKRSGRTNYVERRAAFPGYLFFAGDGGTLSDVRSVGRPCSVIRVEDQDRLRRELAQLERALRVNPRVQVSPAIVKGRRCRIVAGGLVGLEGVVVRREGRSGVLLEVSVLGQGIEVQTDAGAVELIG